MSRRNTAGVTDYFQANRTSTHSTCAIEDLDATHHNDEVKLRRRGCVEGGSVGQALRKFGRT